MMAFRRSNSLSYQKNTISINPDEIPQVPPAPVTQKVIQCDVPDISFISDTVADGEFYLRDFKVPNYGKDPIPPVMISQFQPTITSKVVSTNGESNFSLSKKNLESSATESVQNLDTNITPDIRDCLKRQDEKLNSIKEQVSRILEQKAAPCCHDNKTYLAPTNELPYPIARSAFHQPASKEIALLPNRSSSIDDSKENSQLFSYLQAHSEKIQKLQDQVNLLLLRTMEPQPLVRSEKAVHAAISDQVLFPKHVNECHFINEGTELFTETRNKQNGSRKNIGCHQQAEVKRTSASTMTSFDGAVGNFEFRQKNEGAKTSTSTMTSLTLDGNDKLVYHKLHTVVMDYSKHQKDMSAQFSFNREVLSTPENQVPSKDSHSSSRRKKGKCRKCGKCSPQANVVAGKITPIAYPNLPDVHGPVDKQLHHDSPHSRGESVVSENDKKRNEILNTQPKRNLLPRCDSILRNVSESILNNGDVHEMTAMPQKAIIKPNSRRQERHTPSPRTSHSLSIPRKLENRRHADQRQSSSSSNTSTESVHISPECRKSRALRTESDKVETNDRCSEPSAISKYGLSSPNLSVATKEYLENHGLVRDKNRDSNRGSSGKVRTSLTNRYLR